MTAAERLRRLATIFRDVGGRMPQMPDEVAKGKEAAEVAGWLEQYASGDEARATAALEEFTAWFQPRWAHYQRLKRENGGELVTFPLLSDPGFERYSGPDQGGQGHEAEAILG
jgi:hypothetical protein